MFPGRLPNVRSSRLNSSSNWSGAYLLPKPGKQFVQVWGQWVVPCPELPASRLPENDYYECSTWIGLDGQRRYRSSTLPQIGTLQTVNGKKKTATAWIQWWQRGNPRSTPITLTNFPVDPGDRISCVLTVLTELNPHPEQSVLFNIVNQTKANVMGLRVAPPTADDGKTRLWIPGATAEWVMERPTELDEEQRPRALRLLADYGSLDFTGCVAVEAADADPLEEARVTRTLDEPRFIRMFEVRTDPPRSAYISYPSPIDTSGFNVTYAR